MVSVLNLFSPEIWQAFRDNGCSVTGFSKHQQTQAERNIGRMVTLRTFIIICALVALPVTAQAKALIFDCKFERFASEEGFQIAENFKLSFTYDTMSEQAFLTGNLGLSEVFSFKGPGVVTFLEPLVTGAVQSTTIMLETGQAVHSRHTVIDIIVPTQYYGKCQISDSG